MKRFLAITAIMAAALAAETGAAGQSLKDLLNKGKDIVNNENVQDIVGSVTESLGIDLTPDDIEGTWDYSGTAVKFTSDNMLASAASTLASSQVESTLNEYLQKIGLKEGTFS